MPLRNSTNVHAAFVIPIAKHCAIAHQTPDVDVLADFIQRRNFMTRRKPDEMLAPSRRTGPHYNQKRIGSLLDERREDLIEVIFVAALRTRS